MQEDTQHLNRPQVAQPVLRLETLLKLSWSQLDWGCGML